MPYNVPAGSILEMQHRYQLQGQQCINVYHYVLEDAISDAGNVLPFFLSDFDTKVANVIQGYQTTECVNGRIRGQYVHPVRYVYQEVAMASAAGTQPPPTVSIGTSLVVKRTSDVASRSARGRVYIGGLASGYLTVGTWNSTLTDAIRTAIQNAVKSTIIGDIHNAFPVIWSYTDAANSNVVVNALVDQYARYQRRREVGRGE